MFDDFIEAIDQGLEFCVIKHWYASQRQLVQIGVSFFVRDASINMLLPQFAHCNNCGLASFFKVFCTSSCLCSSKFMAEGLHFFCPGASDFFTGMVDFRWGWVLGEPIWWVDKVVGIVVGVRGHDRGPYLRVRAVVNRV